MPQLTTLYIPNWAPTPLNKLKGHWAVGAQLKKGDREMIGVYARLHDLPPAKAKRTVQLIVGLEKGQRAWDGDALFKSCLDAMTAAKLLVNDSPAWCVCKPVEYVRGRERFTLIVLEE